MKLTVSLIVLIAVFSVWNSFRAGSSPAPCAEPIAYGVGEFDRRFDLSQKDFLAALAEAEIIWEKPINKDLFSYSPEKGELAINLIYDYRQQVTEELGEIQGEVKEDEVTYRILEANYLGAKARHDELKGIYQARVSELEARQPIPREEYQQLKILESEFNAAVRDVNVLVDKLNRLARVLNLTVEQYNTIGASRGETFAGGLYTSDASGERIDIFEFSNHDKLVRVLAHELGHTLGLDHVDDPQAIMYKLNEGEVAKANVTDIFALKALCGI